MKNSCDALNIDMRYVRSNIENRKEWKTITDKLPSNEVTDIWDGLQHPRSCDVKFLATLTEYNVPDIQDRFRIYLSSPPTKNTGNSLENYMLRYGEKLGREKFLIKNLVS